jgi:predicted aspartyl protease
MVKFPQAILLALSFSLTAIATFAQSQEGCYMTDSNGRVISLGTLCGETNVNPGATALRSFQVPIKRHDSGTPVIEVVFNGQQTFEMLVDTGASHTVITPAMAQTLGLKPVGVTTAQTVGGPAIFPLGLVNSMSAGNINLRDVVVAVAPTMDIGLLGQDFYGSYDITIREKIVEFRPR